MSHNLWLQVHHFSLGLRCAVITYLGYQLLRRQQGSKTFHTDFFSFPLKCCKTARCSLSNNCKSLYQNTHSNKTEEEKRCCKALTDLKVSWGDIAQNMAPLGDTWTEWPSWAAKAEAWKAAEKRGPRGFRALSCVGGKLQKQFSVTVRSWIELNSDQKKQELFISKTETEGVGRLMFRKSSTELHNLWEFPRV